MRNAVSLFTVLMVEVIIFNAVTVQSNSESSGITTEDVTDRNGNKIGEKRTIVKTKKYVYTGTSGAGGAAPGFTQDQHDLINRLLKEATAPSSSEFGDFNIGSFTNIEDAFKDLKGQAFPPHFNRNFFKEQQNTPAPTQPPSPPPPPPTTTTPPPPPPVYQPPPPPRVFQPPPPQPSPTPPPQCGTPGLAITPLIVLGDKYTRGDWPWLVALYTTLDGGFKYICSGTLISNRHVVTAAHCMLLGNNLFSLKPTDIVVRVGAFNLDVWGEDVQRSLSDARVHDDYNSTTLANDIAIMTFVRPVEFSNYIQPVCLWDFDTNLDMVKNSVGVVTGWGKDENGLVGRGPPKITHVPIVGNATCRASHSDFHKFTNNGNTFCAGKKDGSGPCNGDSGGGLYLMRNRRWYIRGLVSLALLPENGLKDHCNLDEYLVFTDVAKFRPWITSFTSR